LSAAAALCLAPLGLPSALALTDDDVVKAIDKAKQSLISQQGQNGFWPEQRYHAASADYGHSETALFTLIYTGEHPNRPYIERGLEALMGRALDYTYAISMRAMAYATLLQRNLVSGQKRDLVRTALKADALALVAFQGSHGGWDYKSLGGSAGRYDLSNTQLAILALREAALAGIEIPDVVWQRSQALYFKLQKQDGAWNYGEHNAQLGQNTPGYGSMTAAGLASIFITADNLDLNSGCPCRGGVSNKTRGDLERRIDTALRWLSEQFRADANPKSPHAPDWHRLYWLYAVERVGIAAGFKYFGDHNWYKEGAEWLLKNQQPGGAWGGIPETCFALMFLYKGRAPILYEKLEFKAADGRTDQWNNHRRDIANLTGYVEKQKEQLFAWQIVNLRGSVEELHEAPILYITPEAPPAFSDADKKKLREFTDTGGTILVEASCGNPTVRKWFTDFAKEVWPEWPLKPLGPDHGSFQDPNPLKQRPEILGVTDGIRTAVFYAMDDVSCPWQTKALASKDYLFKWGINLFTYATDHAPLRYKLSNPEKARTDRYKSPVRGGDKTAVQVARLKYNGDAWMTGRNYKCFEPVIAYLSRVANVNLKANDAGAAAAELKGVDAAYIAAAGPVTLSSADRQALKDYLAGGGFLWIEAAAGLPTADPEVQKLAAAAGWQLKPLPKEHPAVTGTLKKALGYNLAAGVQFSRALKVARLGPRAFADLSGIYQDGKLVGIYSPFDVLYSATGYEAYGRRGYQQEDALAVATNIVLCLTDRPGLE